MKYAFFGTPEFAAIILEKLINTGYIPEAVVCAPDKPVGRQHIIAPPPTKRVISEKGLAKSIKILQPENLFTLRSLLLTLKADFFIVAAYSKILPKEILEIPQLGAVGVHPSLLPKYRGPSPIQTAILKGDEETGTTLYLMDEKIDRGPILVNSRFQIPDSRFNYETLMRKLAELSANLLIETLPDIEEKVKNAQPQNESEATYTKKFKAEDGFANLSKDDPVLIERKIRALNPEPGVYTFLKEKRLKLLQAELSGRNLEFTKVQLEGKKPTTDRKFIKNLIGSSL